ncbi:M56 family metallopeptidase [Paenibacillus eucommiae]|uniref:Beta-lactamase regulating signal transducer with metallopeptidase domain n=1 Tax=Paenibacillus eucommiae TaxID=1355755 RepID=A0ABS4ISU2_9BACL|nr:M56 family metallopeptidase [Paenibacillus eucommiae]MBP1989654.1 beta-lactamase regulating signal transducer with metallopeptidase domain [Paenibacillus eucommiae]
MTLNRTNSVLLAIILIGIFIWLEILLFLIHEVFNYHLLKSVFNFSIPLISYESKVYPIVSIGMYSLIIYSSAMIVWRISLQCMESIQWRNFLRTEKHDRLSNQLMNEYAHLKTPIIVIRNDHRLALTYGFLRPKIIISTGIIHKLNENELKAIMLHQYTHCKSYNPLRSLIAWIIKESMPFMPIQRGLFHYLRIWMILQADRYVITKLTSSEYSNKSILLTCEGPPQSDAYRIQQIIQQELHVRVPLWSVGSLLTSFIMLLSISIFIVSIGY